MNTSVELCGVTLKNPVMTASGTFGSGAEYSEFTDLNRLGAVVTKGVANVPWPGNPTPRVAEVYGGMLNAVGLQNPGIDLFCERDIPFLKKYDTVTAENLDSIITIEDDELIMAFLDMVENHKMIVENSGLLTVAALRHLDFTGKKVVSILSGGNMDVITMSSVVQHGLIQRDRIFTVSVLIPDKAGELVRVASIIAQNQGNVIKLDHNQFVTTNRNAAVELKVTMEAFGTDHKNQIVKALEDAGCKPKVIRASL